MNETFYGLAKNWLRNDQLYKFYITKEAILGIKIGGQFFDKVSVRVQLWWLYLTLIGIPLVEVIAYRAENRRLKLEKEAENDLRLAGQSDDSLVIHLSDITNVTLTHRRDWWTMWINSGAIRFKCLNQANLEFVLTGRQDHEKIAKLLIQQGITVEQ